MDLNTIIPIILIAFAAWFLYSRFAGVRGLRPLTAEQLQEALKTEHRPFLIDVREPAEVKQGYIPGAVNIPLSRLKQRIGEIPRNRPLYLYCRSGMRSKQAARILQNSGYRELAHLQGGIMAWTGRVTK